MKRTVALLAWLALSACTAAEEKPVADLYIGGFLGSRITINVRGDQCLYRISSGDDTDLAWQTIVIKQADFDDFIKTCETIGVFKWNKEYADPNVADGTQWSVKIRYHGRKVSVRGDNKYPPLFDLFKAAVVKLTGHKFE